LLQGWPGKGNVLFGQEALSVGLLDGSVQAAANWTSNDHDYKRSAPATAFFYLMLFPD